MARVNLETNPRLVTEDPSYPGARAKGWVVLAGTATGTALHEHILDVGGMFGGGDKWQRTSYTCNSSCPAAAYRQLYRKTANGTFAASGGNPESAQLLITLRGVVSGMLASVFLRAYDAVDTNLGDSGHYEFQDTISGSIWQEYRVPWDNLPSGTDHVRAYVSFSEMDPNDSYQLEIDNILIEKKAGTSSPVGGWFAGGTGYGGTWDGSADDSTSTAAQATISSVSPQQVNAGTTITITGTNFGLHSSASSMVPDDDSLGGVIIGTVPVTVINSWSPTQIVCVVPPGLSSGNNDVKVTGSAWCGGEQSAAYTVNVAQATITTISPSTAKPGTIITVNGAGFGNSGTITVGGVSATIQSWSTTRVLFICPQVDSGENLTVSLTPSGATAITTTIDIIAPDLKIWLSNQWQVQPVLKYYTGSSWSAAGILKYYRNGAWFTVSTDHGTGPVEGPTLQATSFGVVGDSVYNPTTGVVTNGTNNASMLNDLWAACAPGTTVVFPAGVYYSSATIEPPNGVIIVGADRFNQRTGSGTWLYSNIVFGSNQIWKNMLVGRGEGTRNRAGASQTYFYRVRFKASGGSSGCTMWLGGEFPSYSRSTYAPPLYVSSTIGKRSCSNITWEDCQFEVCGTSYNTVYICADWRAGGSYIHDLYFKNCHFGVLRSKNSTLRQGNGGQAFLSQMFPNEYCFRDVYSYDWMRGDRTVGTLDQLWSYFLPDYPEHKMPHDIVLDGCEFEELSTETANCLVNMCDNARAAGLTYGVAGLPASPTLHWTPGTYNWTKDYNGVPLIEAIPEKVWADRNNVINCILKVYAGGNATIHEKTRFSTVSGNQGWNDTGDYGQVYQPLNCGSNTIIGSGTPPYTADPYDP